MSNPNITRDQANRDLAEGLGYALELGRDPLQFLMNPRAVVTALAVAAQAGADYALATGLDLDDPPEAAIDIAQSLKNDGVRFYPYCGEKRRKAIAAGEDPAETIERARALFYAEDPAQDGIAAESEA